MTARSDRARITGNLDINVLLSFAFGVLFISVMLGFAVFFANPTPWQIRAFVTVLALAAAGVGAVIPGYLKIQYKGAIRAGGALALFATVYWFQPTLENSVVKLIVPPTPPDPVASRYLAVIDGGDLRKAWEQLDPAARETIAPDFNQFQQIYASYRAPLGEVTARDLVGLNAATSPSGYPVGIYRNLTYKTKFSKAASCRAEAVTLRATQDLQWQVFSHLIGPTSIDC